MINVIEILDNRLYKAMQEQCYNKPINPPLVGRIKKRSARRAKFARYREQHNTITRPKQRPHNDNALALAIANAIAKAKAWPAD